MATFFSLEELIKTCESIPYPVEAIADPATFTFPCIVKFLLVPHESTIEGVEYHHIVYAVSIGIEDFQEFYTQLDNHNRTGLLDNNDRPGLEGYQYAESEDDSASGSTETEAPADTE